MILRGVKLLTPAFLQLYSLRNSDISKAMDFKSIQSTTQTTLKPQADDTYCRAPLTYGAHKLYYYQLYLERFTVMFYMEISCLRYHTHGLQ